MLATTLRRAKKPIDQISEAMGHSSIAVTMNHYIGTMNSEEIFGLNDALY
jgi:integrase